MEGNWEEILLSISQLSESVLVSHPSGCLECALWIVIDVLKIFWFCYHYCYVFFAENFKHNYFIASGKYAKGYTVSHSCSDWELLYTMTFNRSSFMRWKYQTREGGKVWGHTLFFEPK
jgi:hypothetical protein